MLIYEKSTLKCRINTGIKLAPQVIEKALLVYNWQLYLHLLLYLTENFVFWTEKGFLGGEICTCIVEK